MAFGSASNQVRNVIAVHAGMKMRRRRIARVARDAGGKQRCESGHGYPLRMGLKLRH